MRESRSSSRFGVAAPASLAFSLVLCACAGGGSDPGGEEPGTRTEIVYVVEDSQQVRTADLSGARAGVRSSPPVTPPPKVEEPREEPVQAPVAPSAAKDGVAFAPDGEYAVQIGMYADPARARERLRQLKALGYPAYLLPSDQGVRLRIGYFTRRAEADSFGQRFSREQGGQFWVDRRSKEREGR